jgi:hypothetical protein
LNEGFILRLEKAGGRAGEAVKASRMSIRDPERRFFCAATGLKAKASSQGFASPDQQGWGEA